MPALCVHSSISGEKKTKTQLQTHAKKKNRNLKREAVEQKETLIWRIYNIFLNKNATMKVWRCSRTVDGAFWNAEHKTAPQNTGCK